MGEDPVEEAGRLARAAGAGGAGAADQLTVSRSRARVEGDVEQAPLLLDPAGVFAIEIGSSPSLAPTTNTTGHSRPLAACTEARVTPSTTWAACALGPLLRARGRRRSW